MSSLAARDACVRRLQEQDIAIAADLSAEAGWNQTPEDWRMLLRLYPEGCFGIDADGRLVSTTALIPYGGQLGWIGMVLTNTPYRRRGLARTMLLHAVEQADLLGIESLKLDATDQGQPLYESLGFRVEQPVERWWRPAGVLSEDSQAKAPAPPPGSTVWGAASGRHSAWQDFDLHAYSADRSRLLRALAERGRVYTQADGFCLSRPGRLANSIGPCISQSPALTRQFIQTCGHAESYWDLLPRNQAALEIATELGFTLRRKLIRMVRGRDLRGREDWIYAIAGFELG